jgi:hypothetical protein
MNKFAGIVAGLVSALTLSFGTAMAGSADFEALKNLGQSIITPMTEAELNGVVGAYHGYSYGYGKKNSYGHGKKNSYGYGKPSYGYGYGKPSYGYGKY